MALNPQNIEKHKFKPGQSGNPKGHPKGLPNSKTRYKRLLELVTSVKNPVTGELEEFSVLEQMDMKIMAKALRGDLQAYKEILDRFEGKVKDKTEEALPPNPIYFVNQVPTKGEPASDK